MPVYKCSNGKYRIGTGPCMYGSKAKAMRAYAAYRAKTHTEALALYVKMVVREMRKILEDTTSASAAALVRKNVWRAARRLRKRDHDLKQATK